MSKTEHSRLPWEVALYPDSSLGQAMADVESDGVVVAFSVKPKDAQFIITAVNSYYDNQQAISELVKLAENFEMFYPHGINPDLDKLASVARALIAKHKAKP